MTPALRWLRILSHQHAANVWRAAVKLGEKP